MVLSVLVSETGTTLDIRVIEGARAGLTEAAVTAVRQWEFEPAVKNGAPVRSWTTIRIPFEAIPFPTPGGESPPVLPTPSPTSPTSSALAVNRREVLTPVAAPPTRASVPPSAPQSLSPAAAIRRASLLIPPPGPPEPPSPRGQGVPDSVYLTRRLARLVILPGQARVYVDEQFIGIADDWDDRGGGSAFLFTNRGPHRVRAELAGYRTLEVEIDVTPAAEQDLVAVVEEMELRSRVAYTQLRPVSLRTRGLLELRVDPPDASISINGRDLGPASELAGPGPIRLSGPAVHELVFSSPGRRARDFRVLVSPMAALETATLDVNLR